MFLLYAVIWGVFTPLRTVGAAPSLSEEVTATTEQAIRSVEDPFDVKMRAPGLVELFLKGLADIQRQLEEQRKEAQAKLEREREIDLPTVDTVVVQQPVKTTPLDMPQMTLTGIVYGTERPQAIINGRVVSAGAVVDGVSIVKIEKGRVDVRFGDNEKVLKLKNE